MFSVGAPAVNLQSAIRQTVDRPFARAGENHYECEADGEEMILESFTLLIASPVQRRFISGLAPGVASPGIMPIDHWTISSHIF